MHISQMSFESRLVSQNFRIALQMLQSLFAWTCVQSRIQDFKKGAKFLLATSAHTGGTKFSKFFLW